MPFVRHPKIKGLVYVPKKKAQKKHPCKDCFNCLYCSDDRCSLCLRICKEKDKKSKSPSQK